MRVLSSYGSSASTFVRGGEMLSAVSVIRIWANAPNRLLVRASDGRTYVLKFYDKRTKDRAALRESLGTELAAHLGLPVPRWSPMYVSTEFTDAIAHLWSEADRRMCERPAQGHYFASEMIGQNPGETAVDHLPKVWMDRIENRAVFGGALLLDIWASTAQARQAVFLQEANSSKFQAVFIGFREMFSSFANASSNLCAGRYSDRRIYDGCWNEPLFSFWQRKILAVTEHHLSELLLALPGEWVGHKEAEQIISRLVADQEMIQRLQFGSFDPCSVPWNHPRTGLPTDREKLLSRRFSRLAFGL